MADGDQWRGMSTPAPREPNAEMRTAAKAVREWFLALVAEGFSEGQALQIIGYSMRQDGGPS